MKNVQIKSDFIPFIGILLLASIITLFLFLRFTLLPTPPAAQNTDNAYQPANNPLVTGTGSPAPVSPVLRESDYVYGPTDAPVTVVIFSDFACPYCREMALLLKNEIDTNKKAKVIWRDYPVVSLYPDAPLAHTAAWCAGKEGKFWEFHDSIFAAADRSQENIVALGTNLGFRPTSFRACMESDTAKAAVLQNIQEGDALGIDGTPYLFIGDQRVSGLISAEELTQTINLHATTAP